MTLSPFRIFWIVVAALAAAESLWALFSDDPLAPLILDKISNLDIPDVQIPWLASAIASLGVLAWLILGARRLARQKTKSGNLEASGSESSPRRAITSQYEHPTGGRLPPDAGTLTFPPREKNTDTPVLEILRAKEEAMDGVGGRGWGLVIRNSSRDTARGCSARLETFDFETPISGLSLSFMPTDRPLHWAGQEKESYEIPGEQKAHLNVVYFERRHTDVVFSNDEIVTIAYLGTEQFRKQHNLAGDYPVLILLNITCEKSVPQYAVCRIAPDLVKSRIKAGLVKEAPFSLLWAGMEKRELSDFQSGEIVQRPADEKMPDWLALSCLFRLWTGNIDQLVPKVILRWQISE